MFKKSCNSYLLCYSSFRNMFSNAVFRQRLFICLFALPCCVCCQLFCFFISDLKPLLWFKAHILQQRSQLSIRSAQTSIRDVKACFCSSKWCFSVRVPIFLFFRKVLFLVLFFNFFLDKWIVSIYADTCYLKLHPDVLLLIFKSILKWWGRAILYWDLMMAFLQWEAEVQLSLIFRPTLLRVIDGRIPSFQMLNKWAGSVAGWESVCFWQILSEMRRSRGPAGYRAFMSS